MASPASSKETLGKAWSNWAEKDDEILRHPLFRLLYECHEATGPIDLARVNWKRAGGELRMPVEDVKSSYWQLLAVMRKVKRDEDKAEEADESDNAGESNEVSQYSDTEKEDNNNHLEEEFDEDHEVPGASIEDNDDYDDKDYEYVEDEDDNMN